jgi:hypothetical protein
MEERVDAVSRGDLVLHSSDSVFAEMRGFVIHSSDRQTYVLGPFVFDKSLAPRTVFND